MKNISRDTKIKKNERSVWERAGEEESLGNGGGGGGVVVNVALCGMLGIWPYRHGIIELEGDE